jgi:recombination protein RecR
MFVRGWFLIVFQLPESITALIAALGRLPGIGPRSAERIALHLVQAESGAVKLLADTILTARDRIRLCSICGALTEADPCACCTDDRRDPSLICVVEQPTDILSIEKSASFKGRYHVLGGRISPLNGVEPEDLRLDELARRLKSGAITELIVALATDVEGDATSYYLAKQFASDTVRVTRLAQGLSAGSGLEYADEITLTRALEGRRELK